MEGIADSDRATAQAVYFARGRACLRTSPLAKTFGWGIHCDADGKVALYAVESQAYSDLVADASIKKVPALRGTKH